MLVTSLVIASARRVFCCSDLPGHNFTITCGILLSSHLFPVLLVADLFAPIASLAVELFQYGNVSHPSHRSSSMPVLLTGRKRKPHHITWPDLLNRSALELDPTTTSGHDKSLPERMRMPCRSSTGFKCDT